MASDGHLGMTALSRVTLASAGFIVVKFETFRIKFKKVQK